MKIVHLLAGAGEMYCGSCLHGNRLAAALRAAGEDVLLVPLYTPIRTDEENVSIDRVAFGGINVYWAVGCLAAAGTAAPFVVNHPCPIWET